MANSFPTSLNSYTGSETLLGAQHASAHNAVESKIGVDGSAVTTSFDYKLSGVTGSDKAVSKTGTETLTNKTLTTPVLTTPTLTTPQIVSTGSINDDSANPYLKFTKVASAVNQVTVTNAATGNAPSIAATGGDTTAALGLSGKAASVQVTGEFDNGNTGTAQTISWKNGDRQKSTLTGNCTYTYSNATAGQTLTLRIVEDATGGRTVTLPTSKWPGGAAGTFTTTASAINLLIIYYDGTNYLTQLAAGFA